MVRDLYHLRFEEHRLNFAILKKMRLRINCMVLPVGIVNAKK